MLRNVKLIGRLALILLVFSGCGGSGGSSDSSGSGTPVTATVVAQLTKVSSPSTVYAVGQMTISIQKTGRPVLHGVTGVDGVANISVTETGRYQVVKVNGLDVSGLAIGSEGREFVKDNPITTAAPAIDYTPASLPEANVTADGTVAVNIPVPDIRKVIVIKKGNINAGGNDNPVVSTTESTDFPGRIIVSNIHFTYPDGISLWSNTLTNNHLTLGVLEATNQIAAILWVDLVSNRLGSIASGVTSWPYAGQIALEAPSETDWALSNGSTVFSKGASGPSFGLFAKSNVLNVYNFGTIHVPAGTNILDYEIQRFEAL
jgi:hypothetical protein